MNFVPGDINNNKMDIDCKDFGSAWCVFLKIEVDIMETWL